MKPHLRNAPVAKVLLLICILTILCCLAYLSRRRPTPRAPEPQLADTALHVDIRLYAESIYGPVYIFINTTTQSLCYVDEATWLGTYRGDLATCVWQPIDRASAPVPSNASIHPR